MVWTLAGEFLALVLLVMVALFFQGDSFAATPRRRLFQRGLYLSMAFILLNGACVVVIERGSSHAVSMVMNSAYFLACLLMLICVGLYVFGLLLEHVYDKDCIKRVKVLLGAMAAIFALAVALNPLNGMLFSIDQRGGYHRGPLNAIGYGLMLAELAMGMICYFKHRASVDRHLTRVIWTLFPVLLLLGAVQVIWPDFLLNGTMVAFTQLALFINCQNTRVEQDSLTGLGNRQSLYEELSLRLAGGQSFQVIAVGLCDFLWVNYHFGYRRGDEFLYHIARWIEDFSPGGRAFRLGNVSFALVCPWTGESEAEARLTGIRARFAQPWAVGENQCVIQAAAVGVACLGEGGQAVQVVEALVDMLEQAKKCEDKVCMQADTARALKRRQWLTGLLRDAADMGRLQVWYQPIYDLNSGRFETAEALLRLRDEEGNLVSPDEFIPLAEEKGLIDQLCWVVLENVCRLLNRHPALPLSAVSVNLSARQFGDERLPERVSALLEKHRVEPRRLKLEITERDLSQDPARIKRMMRRMTQLGVGFYLDDFGTGYANFESVMHLPFECVKLDRSLFTELLVSPGDRQIIQTLVKLFGQMGLGVVCEGIETAQQLSQIRQLGAGRVQGFVFARPMDEAALIDVLGEGNYAALEPRRARTLRSGRFLRCQILPGDECRPPR